MAKFTKTGRFYVDSQYGYATDPASLGVYNPTTNPDGWGGPKAPYATLHLAASAASTLGAYDQVVICSGYFLLTEAVTGTRRVIWEAEGQCIVDGSGLMYGQSGFQFGAVTRWVGITFRNFAGTKALIRAESDADGKPLIDCRLEWCYIQLRLLSMERCIAIECLFSNTPLNSGIRSTVNKCTFVNCRGGVNAGAVNITSNIFCNSNIFFSSLPADRAPNTEVDYNCIIGVLNNMTQAEWLVYGSGGYQQSGIAADVVEDIFNDYDYTRTDKEVHLNDFTMKPTCVLHNRGKDNLEVGAKRIAVRLSAADLWNTYKASSSNLVYEAGTGFITLSPGMSSGTYESNWIPLSGTTTLDMLNAFANFLYVNNKPTQFIDQNADAAANHSTNQKNACDVDFALNNDGVSAPVWQQQEINRVPLLSGGFGTASDSYVLAGAAAQSGSYMKFKFTLRDTTL